MQAIIDLPQTQMLAIREIAQAKATTESSLLQKIIDEWLTQQQKDKAPHPMRESFGLWKGHSEMIDGVEYQNRLRAEWD